MTSETLIIGFDSSNGECISALSVARADGHIVTYLNTLYGKEAEEMYLKLTTCNKLGNVVFGVSKNNLERGNKNE